MKMIKNVLAAAAILTAGVLSAQSAEMKNMLKVGANVGVALPSDNAAAALGFDLAYQNLITPGFGLGVATGYTQYFGKENNGYDNNSFGVVPVAGMIRIYPKKSGFYFGTDLGYGFIVGKDEVASNIPSSSINERPTGGFYLKPEIGYHNANWNFGLQYQRVFTSDGDLPGQDFSLGSLGVGVSYNIPLGK